MLRAYFADLFNVSAFLDYVSERFDVHFWKLSRRPLHSVDNGLRNRNFLVGAIKVRNENDGPTW
jgi:hypothetical protein